MPNGLQINGVSIYVSRYNFFNFRFLSCCMSIICFCVSTTLRIWPSRTTTGITTNGLQEPKDALLVFRKSPTIPCTESSLIKHPNYILCATENNFFDLRFFRVEFKKDDSSQFPAGTSKLRYTPRICKKLEIG